MRALRCATTWNASRNGHTYPVVAYLMDTAAGGAYYLASASDYVVSGHASVVGGIGVVLNLFNLRDLMAMVNVIPQGIKAGEFTDIGTSARALTEGEKKILQAMADDFHKQLSDDVKRNRPAIAQQAFDGRPFHRSGSCKRRDLWTGIGDLDDAIQQAANMGCPGMSVRPGVVMYRRNNDPARSVYAVTANVPLQGTGIFPSVPGIDRCETADLLERVAAGIDD